MECACAVSEFLFLPKVVFCSLLLASPALFPPTSVVRAHAFNAEPAPVPASGPQNPDHGGSMHDFIKRSSDQEDSLIPNPTDLIMNGIRTAMNKMVDNRQVLFEKLKTWIHK